MVNVLWGKFRNVTHMIQPNRGQMLSGRIGLRQFIAIVNVQFFS